MKKKYVTFTVRAAYQPKDNTIHLTSKDLPDNWHLTLNRHTAAETILRKELVAADLIGQHHVAIPEKANYPMANTLPWHQVPLGLTHGSQVVTWNVNTHPHMLITGLTGTGKSVLNRNLLLHAARHPQWQVVGIDLQRVELSVYRGVPALKDRIFIKVDLESATQTLQHLQETLLKRYELMEAAGVNHYTALRDNVGEHPRPIMLLIDEAFTLLPPEGGNTLESRQRDLWHEQAMNALMELTALGRPAGIHVIVATQRLDPKVISGALRSRFDMRVTVGRLPLERSMLLLDSKAATNLPTIKGRGIVLAAGSKPQETQFYWSPLDLIQEILPITSEEA